MCMTTFTTTQNEPHFFASIMTSLVGHAWVCLPILRQSVWAVGLIKPQGKNTGSVENMNGLRESSLPEWVLIPAGNKTPQFPGAGQ